MSDREQYIRASIREHLNMLSDPDFVALCMEVAPTVALGFGATQNLTQKVNLLIDYMLRHPAEQAQFAERLGISAGASRSIPIVIAAMTAAEAQQLDQTTKQHNPLRLDRENLILLLKLKRVLASGHHVGQIAPFYAAERKHWQPFFQQQRIEVLITEQLQQARQNHKLNVEVDLSYSEVFFANDQRGVAARRIVLNDGGLCIIDAISMLHPGIKSRLDGVFPLDRMAILVLSPVAVIDEANRLIEEQFVATINDLVSRSSNALELLCESSIQSALSLRRRLMSILPEAKKILEGKYMDMSNREQLRSIRGEPGGIGSIAVGSQGVPDGISPLVAGPLSGV